MTADSNPTVLITGLDPLLRARAREHLEAEGFDVVDAESDETQLRGLCESASELERNAEAAERELLV